MNTPALETATATPTQQPQYHLVEGPPALPRMLLPGEAEELAQCERIIERGMQTFIEVSHALAKVRDRRLYRQTHDTFDEYCQDRWEISARRAQQLLKATETVRAMAQAWEKANPGSLFAMPASEKHVRPLYDLPLEERQACWSDAVTTAPQGKVTGRWVAEKVREHRLRLGLEPIEAAPATAPAQPGATAKTPSVSVQIQATERAIIDVMELMTLAGTSDPVQALGLRLALSQLQGYKKHLVGAPVEMAPAT